VLSHQFLDQLDEATRAAVFGNAGSVLSFQVGAEDSEMLAKQLGGDVTESDLMNLPKFTMSTGSITVTGPPRAAERACRCSAVIEGSTE
jgi:hypothetical protein